jgi:hypothetical protein
LRAARTFIRPWTVALSVAAVAAAGAGGRALAHAKSATVELAAATAAALPAHFAAPYLQIDSSDAGDMAADDAATALTNYTLAFLTPKSGCTAEWEDGGSAVGAFASQISAMQAAGGNVIISFGGESGGELAQTCTNVSQLTAAYQNVVNTYGVTRLDFDIEGGVLSDTAATALRLYGISTAAAYAMMGLTPIAGQNDDNEFFSTANATTLESFAAANGVAELSFWEVDGYDRPDSYQYSTIFNQITSGAVSGGGGSTATATGPVTGYQGLCLDDRAASTANFKPGPGVPLQRHRRPGLGTPVRRRAAQPRVRQVPRRHRLRQRRHPGPDLVLRRHRQPDLETAVNSG